MNAATDISIVAADTPALLDAARDVMREYAAALAVDLSFQGFDAELAALPGEYAPPGGVLLLAHVDGRLAGCGALRAFPDTDHTDACEMKRLYIRPAYRGLGIGRLLAETLIDRAVGCGYSNMLLDTLDDMEAAREMYASLGFEEVPPYYFSPVAGAHYLRVDLTQTNTRY